MLEVQDLECWRGDHLCFTGLSFKVQSGELLHVKGHNGSGKTTLLRTLCGLMTPEQGKILWKGEPIRRLGEDFHQDLTYIGHLNGVKDDLTGLENLRIAGQLSGLTCAADTLRHALRRIGLAGREELPAKVLSQGQRRRVALARLLLTQAKLWILDEPYTALDVAVIEVMRNVIAEHLENGGMVILTTHQDVDIEGVVRQLNLGQ